MAPGVAEPTQVMSGEVRADRRAGGADEVVANDLGRHEPTAAASFNPGLGGTNQGGQIGRGQVPISIDGGVDRGALRRDKDDSADPARG